MTNPGYVKAKDLVTFRTGKLDSNAADPEGQYPFFTCAQETYRINSYSFDTECILLAGNNAGGIFPLKFYKGKFNAYQRTYVIESRNPRRLNIKYFYFYLRPLLKAFEQQATGATTKFLTLKILHNIQVPMLDIVSQKKIAAVLSAYDDLIENNKRRIVLLEELAEEIYREWFVRLRFPGYQRSKFIKAVPSRWNVKKLGEVLVLNYGKALKEVDRVPGEFHVYGSSGVVGTHTKALVKKPGLIVGRKGNVGSIYWSDRGFFPIDTVYYVESELPNSFLYFLLRSMNFINNDAAVPGLNRSQAYANEVRLPSSDLISQYSEVVDSQFKMKHILMHQNDSLVMTRDLLLPRLISGKLSVENLDIQFPPGMMEELDQTSGLTHHA